MIHDNMQARLDHAAEVGRFADPNGQRRPCSRDWLESTMPKPGTGALEALSAVEQASVLSALLQAHPDLQAEAEQLAAGLLAQDDRHAVAEGVADELRALHLR